MRVNEIKWTRLFLAVPLLFLLVFTNIYQDPANIFFNESREIAEAIAKGNAAYSATGNGNEREVKHNLIRVMPDEVECIAVGPSLVMCVNRDIVGTDSFINLGVSSADLYDILAQFGTMEVYGKKTNRVIFCVDSYFFNDAINGESGRHDTLMNYSEYMLGLLSGVPVEYPKDSSNSDIKNKVEQAFSLTYFQAACDQIMKNKKFSMSDSRWGIVGADFDNSKPYYGVDGSWTYALSYQEKGIDFVLDEVQNYNLESQFMYDRHISQYSVNIFEKLVTYLQDRGVEVKLFLCPLAPSLWNRLEDDSEHYFILDELTAFSYSVSEKYRLKLTGSYNPYDLGITDEEFYDARHVRREVLPVYFDFTE